MKKPTEKDAIWCKTQKQWDAIIEMFDLKVSRIAFQGNCILYPLEKGISDCSSKEYAKRHDYNIIKAKDILKKSKIKELEKRVSKLEKVVSDNTDFSTKPLKKLEELPEKWCVRATKENAIWFKDKGYTLETSDNNFNKNNYYHWPSLAFGISSHIIALGYTEITFDQFKKWVLNKEDSKTIEIEGIKNLSIREVQVKVSNQEEANECAEIAKACGEKVKESFNRYIDEDFCTFRMDTGDFKFGVWVDEISCFKTISIQEYRERYGKNEIDWSKAGQFVKNDYDCIWRTTGNHTAIEFEGVCIRLPENILLGDNTQLFKEYSDVEKYGFKLCTEPITLKNE